MNNMSSLHQDKKKDERDNDDSYYCCFYKKRIQIQQISKNSNSMNYSILNKNIINLESLQEVQFLLETYPERQALLNSLRYKVINLDKYPLILVYKKESLQPDLQVGEDEVTLILSYPEYEVEYTPLIIHSKIMENIDFKKESDQSEIYFSGIFQHLNTNICDNVIVIPFSPSLMIIDPVFNELKLECRQALFNLLIPFIPILDKVSIILPNIVPLNSIMSIIEPLISLRIKMMPFSNYTTLIVNCIQENNRFDDFKQYRITFDLKYYHKQVNQFVKQKLSTDHNIDNLPVQFLAQLLWTNKPLSNQQFLEQTQSISQRKSDPIQQTSPVTPIYNYESNYKFELEGSSLKKDKESY
ncbi:unnamed protein product [Paramecium primaurelia]|uniref:Uncharacterized protein n=1 Tax=Paramecium primaurelia TaxID=5886 RepID=A0A8S1JLJ7_PARPR|nr:unnamed protein product [Paramecium primaurelia]